ncbi:MAG: hypothetical protein Q4G35_02685 [Propionibacteriaceae bacterium]|nr:hypothetical protein [Propionibacteriaceae bacterium]
MAETRMFDPGDPHGLQKLVREALGETTRPFSPGDETFRTEHVEPTTPGADGLQASKVPDHILYGLHGTGGGGSW